MEKQPHTIDLLHETSLGITENQGASAEMRRKSRVVLRAESAFIFIEKRNHEADVGAIQGL
jgi:hypothetical protein